MHHAANEWLTALQALEAQVRLFVLGSFALGCALAESDVDLVLLLEADAPRTATLTSLCEFLQQRCGVLDCMFIDSTIAPHLSFRLNSRIKVDLQLARWHKNAPFPKEANDIQIEDVRQVSMHAESSMHALCAVLLAEYVKRLMAGHPHFQLIARAVKAWAHARMIHSNNVGYFGGIAWVLLVVKTCQLHPDASVEHIMVSFFRLWTEWYFGQPDALPVLIHHPDSDQSPEMTMWMSTLKLKPWNPWLRPRDNTHLSPVISPIAPYLNVAFSVTSSTLCVMKAELARGLRLLRSVSGSAAEYQQLMEPVDTTSSHSHLLRIVLTAESNDDLSKWTAWVESKIYLLVIALEGVDHVKGLRPYQLGGTELNGFKRSLHIGLDFEMDWKVMTKPRNMKLSHKVDDFVELLTTWPEHTDSMLVDIEMLRRDVG